MFTLSWLQGLWARLGGRRRMTSAPDFVETHRLITLIERRG
jgi:hypothetical protein